MDYAHSIHMQLSEFGFTRLGDYWIYFWAKGKNLFNRRLKHPNYHY